MHPDHIRNGTVMRRCDDRGDGGHAVLQGFVTVIGQPAWSGST